MNALDSPVEVLALDYLSFGLLTVVNNVWAWVAFLTAAVGVWRIRSTSSPRYQCPARVSLIKPAVSCSPAETAASDEPSPAKKEAPRPSPSVFSGEGRTSGKFTFYYHREEAEEESANGDGDGEDGNGEGKLECREIDGWQVMMETRMGDHMGFYRYQDLTALDGNVVRLWDGCRRRPVSATTPLVSCDGGSW